MIVQVNSRPDLFGLPLASDDKGFVFVIVVHITLSLIAVLSGLTAMLMDKNSRWHNTFGKLYYWAILPAFATVIILSILRWPHNNHLFILGILTTLLVITGQRSAHNKKTGWARLHAICMGSSYILLLTGFYVDNGMHLPFWRMFSQWFFWIFPALIGIPILLYVLRRHPCSVNKFYHAAFPGYGVSSPTRMTMWDDTTITICRYYNRVTLNVVT